MSTNCLLYYITDRKAFDGNEQTQRTRLLDKITEAASTGIDYIQLREKDLSIHDLETLAREAVRLVRENSKSARGSQTRLLINSRVDVALAVGADGVHLPSNDISPKDVRIIWRKTVEQYEPAISISCHSPEDVMQAAAFGADLALFAPVFEKKDIPGITPQGLAALQQSTRAKIPVLALGGITLQNAACCLRAGAAGIAAIRLFQENEIRSVVEMLRGISTS